ncbi:hypothetical protein HNR46_000804 [Haloferula luteola]|uniref:Uncharacterized protein n=1 Tax=Haloferula luteola TaxID=595692 RepID=A0A840V0I5_9BACT|nr:hypothetical protein [Haloferula luteola]MBB5350576.1 hypothetical protein [Haloferula luteola]
MNAFRTLVLVFPLLGFALLAAEIPISLVPRHELGSRDPGYLRFEELVWSTDCEWFHKPAPVCRVVEKPLDLTLVIEEAKKRGMVPNPKYDPGPEEDGAVDYHTTEPPWLGAGGVARKRYLFFGYASFDRFDRDEHQMAVVKPLASREECVRICREWMNRLGIDESQLYRGGDWPEGFEVTESTPAEGGYHPVLKKEVIAKYGQQLRFSQQIGGLPAFWSGFGGCMQFYIADGGEFSGVMGCLRAWEKIGDYEVLDREEVEMALKEGFFWVPDPIDCERLEVIKVALEAYHSDWEVPQHDFPLIYNITCKLHGGPSEGKEKKILIPALRQHRHRYGPPPEPSALAPGEKAPDPDLERLTTPRGEPW